MNKTNLLIILVGLVFLFVLSRIECKEIIFETEKAENSKCPEGYVLEEAKYTWERDYCWRRHCTNWGFG